ncbi:PilN domain-containing protein [Photorhabdus khanii]|uniref:Fimbrial assembly protein n=1 Tax=Photorhabdus khanii subsp. guanajuatensis TaxID=2100166 RepID=A0A4R4JZC1_9GAMM|nr:PilN domain-containing protein [Photorhabdus khanii]TDB60264.1 hypothetical protein C5467_06915 [Photorhabdus khanii subsp. guanajuatensis]
MMYQVNFLPWRQTRLKSRYRWWTILLLLQLALWLAVLIWMSFKQLETINQHQRQLQQLNQQQLHLQQQITQTEEAFNLHNKLAYKLKQQQTRLKQNQQHLRLFNELPELLPEGSWLTAFDDHAGQLKLVANSLDYSSMTSLLDNLENNGQLSEIQLKKMTTTEQQIRQFIIDANWQTEIPDDKK